MRARAADGQQIAEVAARMMTRAGEAFFSPLLMTSPRPRNPTLAVGLFGKDSWKPAVLLSSKNDSDAACRVAATTATGSWLEMQS